MKIILTTIATILLFISCDKSNNVQTQQDPSYDAALKVNTIAPKGIECNKAQLFGEIKLGENFSEKGMVYGKTENPTTSNTKVTDASSNSNIVALANGLQQETKYFYRAYIIQSGQTIYGNQGYFTTPKCNGNGNSGNGIVDTNFYCELNFDGETYRVNYSGINFAPFINPDYNHNSNADPIAGLYVNLENTGLTQFVLAKNSGLDAGFQIHLNEIISQGSYVINASNYDSGDRDVAADKFPTNVTTAQAYDLEMYNRVKNGNNCTSTKLNTKGTLTWNITSVTQISVPVLALAFPTDKMNIYEGNFSGTMYENVQTDMSCEPSRAVPYTCTFRMPCPAY